ncbi:MAG: ATP-binding protein [Thermoflexales bacterium]|nr:ATP-binding protein [Thermoflexales bacterium]
MIRKSLTTGMIMGLVVTLSALYPTFIQVGVLDHVQLRALGQQGNELLHQVLMGMCYWLMITVSLAVGVVAALRARATRFKVGVRAGVFSGLVAAMIVYIILIAPTAAIVNGRDVFHFQPSYLEPNFPETMLIAYAQSTLVTHLDVVSLLAGVVIGWLGGGAVGWLHRSKAPTGRPVSLLDVVEDPRGRHKWFAAYDDQVALAGLAAGLIGGAIIMLRQLSLLNQPNASLGTIFQQAMAGMPGARALSRGGLPDLLAAAEVMVWVGIGGLAIFWLKNPATRLRTRVYAAALAGTVVGVMVAVNTMHLAHFAVGALPQLLWPMLGTPGPRVDMALPGLEVPLKVIEILVSALPMRLLVVSFLSTPHVRMALMYVLPLSVVGLYIIAWMACCTLQGLVYGLVAMVFKHRPVDRARRIAQDLRQHGDQSAPDLLPGLYALFQTNGRAMQVLEHLAFDLSPDWPKARVAAAYHALAARPDYAGEALEVVTQVLAQQPGWKMRTEIQALHGMLAHGLQAATVAQIAAIAPVPEDQTSSLPPQLAKAGELLSYVLIKLQRVERVDDLSSKIIYLNTALNLLREGRAFAAGCLQEGGKCGPALPEFNALQMVLDRWEGVVLSTVKDMQGRAELVVELKTCNISYASRLPLTMAFSNQGLNVAENVTLFVEENEGEYQILEGQQQRIDILSPQDSRELSFVIRPMAGKPRLRVCWTVTYDDALGEGRTLEFGDLIEFVEADKPFQRIFPIPYVTGTPLQSDEMFVGRQDVFEFVREHLLGTYQNNVIVLHGQRRTGKTSVLYRMEEVLADTHLAVLIDMQGKAARGEVDFLYSIADDIAYALENKGISVELPERREFEESPEFFFRSRFLRGVYQALGDKNLLLMFDEFEELQKRVEDGKLTADIFPYLRNLMQHERRVDFVFAGTHKLEELAAEYWSILFNIAEYKKITFLDYAEVARLVTQPVAPYGLEYDPLAIERIYQVTAGHPYFTQLVCHELVAYHNETRRSYLTTTEVNAALEHIIERGEAHFKYIWAESSTSQRLVLLALAELLEASDAATSKDVEGVLLKRGRPLNGHDLPQALASLESRDILMRADPRSNLYRFRVDLIRRWIYASRPAYEKVM